MDELNRLDIIQLTPEQALSKVGAELDSYETRFDFYRNNRELFAEIESDGLTLEQNFERFNREALEVIRPDPRRDEELAPFIRLQMKYPKGVAGPQIANQLVEHAIDRATAVVLSDVEALIANRLAVLARGIATARASYEAEKEVRIAHLTEDDKLKRAQLNDELLALDTELRQRRENRIAQLDEAIGIASALGIKKPTTPSNMAQETRSSGNVVRTEVTNQAPPLYFMGTDTLEAERRALQARETDDFTEPRIAAIKKELQLLETNRTVELLQAREDEDLFLADLARLRAERSRLRGLSVDPERLALVRIDQVAVQPASAIKPKKAMIVAVGMILGGILGTAVAGFRSLLSKRRRLLQ